MPLFELMKENSSTNSPSSFTIAALQTFLCTSTPTYIMGVHLLYG
jgi:hypothetical protein